MAVGRGTSPYRTLDSRNLRISDSTAPSLLHPEEREEEGPHRAMVCFIYSITYMYYQESQRGGF